MEETKPTPQHTPASDDNVDMVRRAFESLDVTMNGDNSPLMRSIVYARAEAAAMTGMPGILARLAAAEQRVRDRDAELLRCRTHENVAAVTLDKTLNREQRDALKVAADLLAVERQRVKTLVDAGNRVVAASAKSKAITLPITLVEDEAIEALRAALSAATQDQADTEGEE